MKIIKFKNQVELSAWLIHCSYRWIWDYIENEPLSVKAQWIKTY